MKHSGLLQAVGVAACVFALAGCAAKPADGPGGSKQSAKALADSPKFANQIGTPVVPALPRASGVSAEDTVSATRRRVVTLDVHQLEIPLGAVSRSEEFWKHVDEQQVDVGTYDLLLKNGWRVGVAPASEYAYFRDIIAAYPVNRTSRSLSAGPGGGGAMEVSLKRAVPYQVVAYFNDANHLFLRSFEDCENLVSIALQQVPRKAGDARVTVCPTVRALYSRYEVSKKESGPEVRYHRPERLYDLNMQVDVPMDHFLVIAPSPQVKWRTSLGATFLVHEEAAERVENVLLIVPHAKELEATIPKAPPEPASR